MRVTREYNNTLHEGNILTFKSYAGKILSHLPTPAADALQDS